MKKLLTLVVTLSLLGVIAVGTTKAAGADMATGSGSVTVVGSNNSNQTACVDGGDIEISSDQVNWVKENLDLGDYTLNSGETMTYNLYVRNLCVAPIAMIKSVPYRMTMSCEGNACGYSVYGDYLNVTVKDVSSEYDVKTLYSGSLNQFSWSRSTAMKINPNSVVTTLEVTYSLENFEGTANLPINMVIARDYSTPTGEPIF